MPLSIRVDPETGVAIVTAAGVLGLDEATEGAKALWKTRGWSGAGAVWDFRNSQFDLSAVEIREVAAFVLENQPENPPARMAFVTDRDLDFGLARMFEVFRSDSRTALQVFRDFDEALDWAASARRASDD